MPAKAERLPVRVFTTSDGLANNHVNRGAVDANGFLWFATGEGMSRFDGNRFESFGTAEGLPAANVHDVIATRDGRIFVATEGGLAVLDLGEPSVRPRFRAVTTTPTDCVTQEATGTVWAGTQEGLVQIDHERLTKIPISNGVISIAVAPDRSLWLGTFSGLVHRDRLGHLDHYRVGPLDEADDRVFRVLIARDGTLWIGHVSPRLLAVTLPLAPTSKPLWEVAGILHLVPDGGVRRDIFEDSNGTIWVGTNDHLNRWNGHALVVVTPTEIGVEGSPTPSVEDSAGNMWFGTDAQGVVRVARDGFVSYDTSDGLDSMNAYGFVEEPNGPLYVVTLANGHALARFDVDHFTSVRPRAPTDLRGWGVGQTAAIDRDHRWWYPTGHGALRYPAVSTVEDLATVEPRVYAALPGRDILRLYADHHGDVWISTMSATGLARWDRDSDQTVTLHDGWPSTLALSFTEDKRGDVWIGYADGQVVHVHEGRPQILPIVVKGGIGALIVDDSDRLWLASDEDGVIRIDDIDHPKLRHYRATDGIESNQALALVADRGKIYVGTTRGIARIDPASGEIVHYGTGDGLRNDYIVAAFRSHDGTLWFGSKGGAARLAPPPERPPNLVPVYVTHLTVAGQPFALASGGQRRVHSSDLASGEGALDLEVASPQFATGSRIRFQYRLDEEWSVPVAEPTFRFARLAAGRYELEVRAIDARGMPSPSASISFTVMPPIWRRWWFLVGALCVVAAAAYLAYRRKLAHAVAIERVRTRIATDLHDELGSSLSRISILSEVASRRAAAREDIASQITVIGTSARELVDVASDIVWSTDPRCDDLGSLLVRIRTFAADLLDARGIAWAITAPSDPSSVKLEPDRRRHLYLVLKEAITNCARHSGATRLDVTVVITSRGITATIRDNGHGFDETALARSGNGLVNMRARAIEAGGTLDLSSHDGTEITLRL